MNRRLNFSIVPEEKHIRRGHVPNTLTPVWFEDARWPLLHALRDISPEGLSFGTVRRATYDYQRELYIAKEVTIETWISAIGRTSATCFQQAHQSGELAATAELVLIMFDRNARRGSPIPQNCRELLEDFLPEASA